MTTMYRAYTVYVFYKTMSKKMKISMDHLHTASFGADYLSISYIVNYVLLTCCIECHPGSISLHRDVVCMFKVTHASEASSVAMQQAHFGEIK